MIKCIGGHLHNQWVEYKGKTIEYVLPLPECMIKWGSRNIPSENLKTELYHFKVYCSYRENLRFEIYQHQSLTDKEAMEILDNI